MGDKMKDEQRKVVLVGVGFVGMSFAYSLLNTGGIDELILIDKDNEKAKGEAMDLNHGLPYLSNKIHVKEGNYEECKDADVVVICAGVNQKEGQSRLELTKINANIMKDITKQVMDNGFEGIFVVASNPVDLMTYVVWKTSGMDHRHIIGTGTLLDTARLRYYIGDYLNISSSNIHAYILGEHGDSSFVPWMNCFIGCKPLLEYIIENNGDMNSLHEIYELVKNAAYEIIERKKATYYGIGLSLNRLLSAIFNDEQSILTVSCYQEGQYHQEGLFIGTPAIIGRDGIRELVKLELNENDQAKFNQSCQTLQELLDKDIM